MNSTKGRLIMRRVAVVSMGCAGALLSAACATMTAEECMVADWYGIGQADARAGRTSSYLANRAGDCAEAGYPADSEAWYQGFADGLGWFCAIDNGFRFGLDGQRYQQSCPPDLEPAFLEGFELGQSIHATRARVAELKGQVDQASRDLRRLERSEGTDPEALADQRDVLEQHSARLREEELELASLLGFAQGRGFNVGR
jgi:hypothetical protein